MRLPNVLAWDIYTAGWTILVALGVILELAALYNTIAGDTASEHVWAIRSHPILFPLFAAAWGWMTFHFFVSRAYVLGTRDIIAAVVGFAWGVVRSQMAHRYRNRSR